MNDQGQLKSDGETKVETAEAAKARRFREVCGERDAAKQELERLNDTLGTLERSLAAMALLRDEDGDLPETDATVEELSDQAQKRMSDLDAENRRLVRLVADYERQLVELRGLVARNEARTEGASAAVQQVRIEAKVDVERAQAEKRRAVDRAEEYRRERDRMERAHKDMQRRLAAMEQMFGVREDVDGVTAG